jgi:hypothetical protein
VLAVVPLLVGQPRHEDDNPSDDEPKKGSHLDARQGSSVQDLPPLHLSQQLPDHGPRRLALLQVDEQLLSRGLGVGSGFAARNRFRVRASVCPLTSVRLVGSVAAIERIVAANADDDIVAIRSVDDVVSV